MLKEHPKHGLALFVKAQLLLGAGEDEAAQKLLEDAAAADPPEPKVLKALGKLYYDAAQWDKAEAAYERGRKAGAVRDELAGGPGPRRQADRRHGEADRGAVGVGPDSTRTSWTSGGSWRSCCRRPAVGPEAERWAQEALEIDVNDAKARELYLKALTEQGKTDVAERVRKVLGG